MTASVSMVMGLTRHTKEWGNKIHVVGVFVRFGMLS